MRYPIFLGFLLGLMNTVAVNSAEAEIESLPITTLRGEIVTLSDYKGKEPVYLKFWATWCRPCRQQMPHFQQVQHQYGEKIKVIAINIGINDSIKRVKETQKKFGLTMPIAIDRSGALAQAFGLIGTPYHILIDKNGRVIHKGFDASSELDNKLALLSKNKVITQIDSSKVTSTKNKSSSILNNIADDNTILFFVATWCDWYLKETRPDSSKQCVTAQNSVNYLYKKFPNYNWIGVVSRLWTAEKELEKYTKKYNVSYPLAIDTSNEVFLKYGVNQFPTLIMLNNNKVVLRVKNFNDMTKLTAELKQRSSVE